MKQYKKGETIVSEGDRGREILTLVSGRVGIFKNGSKIREFSEAGTILGELSVILNRPRTASLIAMEDTSVMPLAKSLDELFEKYPDIIKKMLVNMAERLADSTDMHYLTKG